MNFSQLVINDQKLDEPMNEYKLTLDMSASKFYIPRNYSYFNAERPSCSTGRLSKTKYNMCINM